MKRAGMFLAVAALTILPGLAHATDRDLPMIESAEIFYREYDQFDVVGALVRGQNQTPIGTDISLLLNLGWGAADTDAGDKDLFLVTLGLRDDLSSLVSFLLLADFEWIDSGKDFAVIGARTGLDFRLLPAEAPLSPFVGIAAAYRTGLSTPWTLPHDSFSALTITAEGGLDVNISDHTSVTIRGSGTQSLGLEGGDYAKYANGWGASIGMRYYWHETN